MQTISIWISARSIWAYFQPSFTNGLTYVFIRVHLKESKKRFFMRINMYLHSLLCYISRILQRISHTRHFNPIRVCSKCMGGVTVACSYRQLTPLRLAALSTVIFQFIKLLWPTTLQSSYNKLPMAHFTARYLPVTLKYHGHTRLVTSKIICTQIWIKFRTLNSTKIAKPAIEFRWKNYFLAELLIVEYR